MTNIEAIAILKHLRDDLHLQSKDYIDCFDMAISALEKQAKEKKANIKRLPCTCGRKQLEQWWSSEEGNEGWFYKCPVCGLRSRVVKKCRLNEAWNEAVRNDERGIDDEIDN